MNRSQIYQKLLDLNPVDENALIEYMKICYEASEENTEDHHILPKSLFPEYRSFKSHPWNKAKIKVSSHIRAHGYFAKAFPNRYREAVYPYYSMVNFHKVEAEEALLDCYESARLKHRTAIKNLWDDPDFRIRHKNGTSKSNAKPEIKSVHRNTAISWNNNEEIKQKQQNSKKSNERYLKEHSDRMIARNKNSDYREKLYSERICPFCGKGGKGGMMNRWHFSNCKFKQTTILI